MPHFVEPSFATSSEAGRRQILDMWKGKDVSVLGWYGRKMAGQAVRNMSKDDVRNGLVATAIASFRDFRDELPTIALLYNSTVKIDEDPEELFNATAVLVEPNRRWFLMISP
jgi:hypothetical protein